MPKPSPFFLTKTKETNFNKNTTGMTILGSCSENLYDSFLHLKDFGTL